MTNREQALEHALRLALRYLEHPDVARLPFALPVSVVIDRAEAALKEKA